MWIVQVALKRPYTFVVLGLLILGIGPLTIARTPTDIFPTIDIPVVTVIWNYQGLSAQEMEGRIVTISERAMTTTVNAIEHIESQSLNGAGIGAGVIRVFFQPDASIDAAVAETTAINQTILKVLPAGTTPPFVIRYSATNVPILQLALQSDTLRSVATTTAWFLPFEALYQDALHRITADTHGLTEFVVELGPFGGAQSAGAGLLVWSAAYLALVAGGAAAVFARRDL